MTETSNMEGNEGNKEIKDPEKITIVKRNPSKVAMEEVKEMARRQKDTFTPEECKGKVGVTTEFKKYLYITMVKAMEQGKTEDPHFEGEKEEVAKTLQHTRI